VLSTTPEEADHDVMLRMMFFASVSLAARGPWPDIALCVDAEHQGSAQALFAQLSPFRGHGPLLRGCGWLGRRKSIASIHQPPTTDPPSV